MKTILLHPTYFPTIEQMAYAAQAEKVVWECEDNYQKQTYRNRMYVAHSNGRLLLNIPVQHVHGQRQKFKEVSAVTDFNWQKQHFKSLQTAYRTSPFFEYYEDEIEFLFTKEVGHIMEHNFLIFDFLSELLGLEVTTEKTVTYEKTPEITDLRFLVDAKRELIFQPEPYTQVLQDNHGFIPNLSILDLLFNEGPQALTYLERQELPKY